MARFNSISIAAIALACTSGLAIGQVNTVYDFENLPDGTNVTTQYRGVTFLTFDTTTSFPCVILTESNSTSPTRVLGTTTPGVEFSDESMRLSFTQPQRFVQFAMGPGSLSCAAPRNRMRVTAFNSAGATLFTRDYVVNNAGASTLVKVGSETGPFQITRIEVSSSIPTACLFGSESIDDLTFLPDTTPPVINLTTPANDACVCGNGPVDIRGSVCDPDGIYLDDRLEFATQPDGPWTFINSGAGAVCSGGTLYTWNPAALPSGQYYLRITGRNQDGWTTSSVRRIFLDKSGPAVDLRAPVSGPLTPIYAGTVCFDGSVNNEGCANPTWSLQWRPGSAGPWNTLSTQTSTVNNDPLGSWSVSTLPDGAYQVRVIASDQCSQTTELSPRNVIIDNTPPVALISSPQNCDDLGGLIVVRGTAFDTNMGGWVLQVAGGSWNSWQTIASGSSNIVDGVLGAFASASQPQCQYALRLIVSDRSLLACGGNVQSREFVTTFDVSQPGQCNDIDFNNDGLFPDDNDLIAFLRVLAGGDC